MDIEGDLKKIEIGAKDFIAVVEDGSRQGFNQSKWMLVYDRIFHVTTQRQGTTNYAQVCYELYSRILQEYLTNVTIPKLERAIAARDSGQSFVKELAVRHKKFCSVSKGIYSVFMYLDRHYTADTKNGVMPLKKKAWTMYKDIVWKRLMEEDLGSIVLQHIKQMRICVDQGVAPEEGSRHFRQTLNIILEVLRECGASSLGDFNEKMRECTQDAVTFYKDKADGWLKNGSVAEYLQRVDRALETERPVAKFCAKMFGSDAKYSNSHFEQIFDSLVVNCQQHLLEKKGDGIWAMMKQKRVEPLKRLNKICSLFPARARGLAIQLFGPAVKEADGILQTALKTNCSDLRKFTRGFFQWFCKYADLVKTCSENGRFLHEQFELAFNNFVRENTVISKLLAKASHQTICDQKVDRAESGKILEIIVKIYGYIRDKDVFDHAYQLLLQDRLLRKKISSKHLERKMISSLKAEAGYQWAKQLDGMFEDVALSKTLTKEFNSKWNPDKTKDLEFSITICRHGQWPNSSYAPSKTLPELKDIAHSFRKFYVGRHQERTIQWRMDMGEAEVQVNFNPRTTVRLAVSPYQMCILLCFNRQKVISYGKILDMTGLKNDVTLQNHLLSLAHPKLKVLLKRPNDRSINKTTKFMINGKFTCPLRKITVKLLTIIKQQRVEEVDDAILIKRRCQMDACIVRTVKRRKTMKHTDLVREATAQLQARFTPSPAMIKKRIEHLIEQEYMKRDPNRRGVYEYLA